jgi:hypothetical protein
MTFSAPSFFAAATSASMPPRAWAEVAVAALPPLLLLVEVPLLGGEHAATSSVRPTAIPTYLPRDDLVIWILRWPRWIGRRLG